MTTVRTHFDWIIVDTPPVMAVADATLVAHLATGVVFVVGAEMTSRHAARRALDQLQHVHPKFVGGVLNKVDLHRNPYCYSEYLSARDRAVLQQGVVVTSLHSWMTHLIPRIDFGAVTVGNPSLSVKNHTLRS